MAILIEIQTVFIQMAPYLLLGLLIAGFLHVFINQDTILKHLGQNNLTSVFKAALIGVPLPLCSCGVVPTALSLRKNKASKGATVSFLISTPQTGVDSILATYALMGPIFALFRPIASFIMGIIGGLAVTLLDHDTTPTTQPKNKAPHCESCHSEAHAHHKRTLMSQIKSMLNYAFIEFLDDIALPLIIGIIISGFISFLIPENFFQSYIRNEWLAMGLMVLIGAPLYVCATASIPIATALMLKGLSPGAAFVFLVTGPATNAASMTLIANALGKKCFTIYLSVIALCAIVFGFILNAIFTLTQTQPILVMQHHHHSGGNHWVTLSLSGFLLLLLISSMIKKLYYLGACQRSKTP